MNEGSSMSRSFTPISRSCSVEKRCTVSTPSTRFFQYTSLFRAPGNRQAIPVMAIAPVALAVSADGISQVSKGTFPHGRGLRHDDPEELTVGVDDVLFAFE